MLATDAPLPLLSQRVPARGDDRRRAWAIGAALALTVPLASWATLEHYQARLAQGLGRRAGVSCDIGTVEAGLTGTLRLGDVRLGRLFSAEAVEVSTSWASVLAGELELEEIAVVAPRLAISVARDGSSDLSSLLSRLATSSRRDGDGGQARGPTRPRSALVPRRILVREGELAITVAGVGSVRAQDVELWPMPGGVRASAQRVRLEASWSPNAAPDGAPGAWAGAPASAPGLAAAAAQHPGADRGAPAHVKLELMLDRAAADLALPTMTARRVVAVGGVGALTVGAATVGLRQVSAARMHPRAPLTARLTLDDHGAPRAVELQARLRPSPALAVRGDRIPLWPLADLAPAWLATEHTYFAGQAALARGQATGAAVTGTLDGARLAHPALAATPVVLTAQLDVTATAKRNPAAAGAPTTDSGIDLGVRGSWNIGALALAGAVEVHRGAALSATVDLELATAPCRDLLASVPSALVTPLEGLTLSGETGGRLHVALDTSAPLGEGTEVIAELTGRCHASAEPPGADVTTLREAREHVFPDGSRAAVGPGVGAWVELRSLPAHVDGAFIAAEDARFFSHGGFDLPQIARSLEIDLREGRLARGGSTISQQLVKNEFLDGRRSLARKLSEAVLTWRLEERLDKREILERYLNVIELGPAIWGLAAAAQHWFGVAPQKLSVRQAAFLAALTPEPTTMTRRLRAAGGLDRASAARLDTVLRAMKRHGLLDKDEYEAARDDDLHLRGAALREPTAQTAARPSPAR